jgi:tRNA (mo5U34)-methyltransferase
MDLLAEIERLGPWYHTIDLGNGIETPGRSRPEPKFELIADQLPASLTGLRVLDLGCNAGGIAVQFARRGAGVVGVEAGGGYYRQACWVRDVLGLDIEYHNMSIYDVGSLDGGFDVVLFLGLLYHLRHPQLSLDLLAQRCEGTLIINTPVVRSPARIMELRLPESTARVDQAAELRFNWWFPSPDALRTMLAVAGFTDIVEFAKTESPFVSSNQNADNTSAFPTGTVYFRATGDGSGSTPAVIGRHP